MSDAVEVAIEAALLARAVEFAQANSLTISVPNVAFTPPTVSQTAKWLRATFLPADSFVLGVGFSSSNQHYGFLQIDVFFGQNAGELAPSRVAADIIEYFKRGITVSRDGFTAQVLGTPLRRQIVRDDPWVMVPVRIPYTCFASPPA